MDTKVDHVFFVVLVISKRLSIMGNVCPSPNTFLSQFISSAIFVGFVGIQCGGNSTTQAMGSTLQSQCVCLPGFYGSNGACALCPSKILCALLSIRFVNLALRTVGKYRATGGATSVTSCLVRS